jgi:adenylate kinase
MRLVLLGPPGAGKGTQARRLGERFGLAHIASGDIFRRNVSMGTNLGLRAKEYLDAGELVPDSVTIGMVVHAIDETDGGFILDGFPRTIPQAEALEAELDRRGVPLMAAVAFDLPEEEAVRRVAGRRTCRVCQRAYNVFSSPTAVDGVCDHCGGPLVQRTDESEATVRHRLEVYHQSTEPLLDFYRDRGLLRRVDATGTEGEVTDAVVAALGDLVDA